MKRELKLEDLVILQFDQSGCHINVQNAKDYKNDELQIDLKQRKWAQSGYEFKIGENRPKDNLHYGVIGVYDRNDTKHLNNMTSHAVDLFRNIRDV